MRSRIVVFCMPEPGHFQLLRPVISGLVRHGAEVVVFTDRRFTVHVREAGADLVDLFTKYPLSHADDTSIPIPCRYVSYAGHYAEQIARDMEDVGPSLILCETFSVVGRIVAESLDLPWVNISPGHNLDPQIFVSQLEANPQLSISQSCDRSVASLREKHGMADATPFSFVTSLSPTLNIYCEPPSFLPNDRRQVFEPLAFFGSLLPDEEADPHSQNAVSHFASSSSLKVYVSFGTIVWRYYQREALAALRAISAFLATRPDMEGLISLGNAELEPAERAELASRNVRVESYVDQRAVLREADVFVTHHGINSTHEAILNRVPMLSYPFFWDQPALAATCQHKGLAVPMVSSLRDSLNESEIASAMQLVLRDSEQRRARLERARNDELEVMAGRDAILRQLMRLAARAP